MAGRKRKPGRRERNGRLERTVDPRLIAAQMPHRRELPPGLRHDQKAEDPFGRLNLASFVSDLQYDAGVKFRAIVRRYRAVLRSPSPNPPALTLDGLKYGEPIISDEEAIRRRDEYQRAFEAINGHRQRVILNSVVIFDKPLDRTELPQLCAALNDLVVHFGLTRARKSVHVRNIRLGA